MIAIGIDMGSVGTKTVFFDGKVVDSHLEPTGWNPAEAGRKSVEYLLDKNNITKSQIGPIVATGYGRKSLAIAEKSVTEITCHARGAYFLDNQIRTILDIGGQDSKVIRLDQSGNVVDFMMNDKCAAGTGRFLQVMANLLEYSIEELGAIPIEGEIQSISSMCTVFAESEVVSHLAKGVRKEAVALGLLDSVAVRASSMLARIGIAPGLAFTGGVSRCSSLVSMIHAHTGQNVKTYPQSQFAGALGAALISHDMI
ncbi:MAG: acyl-CoA dehydratase activase [Dethiosulfovibrio sp.]|nr:acyl-CoA dehydratase activase [Dethiosulfovibrio sp.]